MTENRGAYINIGPDYKLKFEQFDAVPHPNIRPMVSTPSPARNQLDWLANTIRRRTHIAPSCHRSCDLRQKQVSPLNVCVHLEPRGNMAGVVGILGVDGVISGRGGWPGGTIMTRPPFRGGAVFVVYIWGTVAYPVAMAKIGLQKRTRLMSSIMSAARFGPRDRPASCPRLEPGEGSKSPLRRGPAKA